MQDAGCRMRVKSQKNDMKKSEVQDAWNIM